MWLLAKGVDVRRWEEKASLVTGRPYRTVFEPMKCRNSPEERLLDVLVARYDDLERLLAQ